MSNACNVAVGIERSLGGAQFQFVFNVKFLKALRTRLHSPSFSASLARARSFCAFLTFEENENDVSCFQCVNSREGTTTDFTPPHIIRQVFVFNRYCIWLFRSYKTPSIPSDWPNPQIPHKNWRCPPSVICYRQSINPLSSSSSSSFVLGNDHSDQQ